MSATSGLPAAPPSYSSPTPDPRIAELESHGIKLARLYCEAECYGSVASTVSLDQFVAAIGVPDKVGSIVDSSPDFAVLLVYGKKGMWVYAYRPLAEDVVNMMPDMRVGQIILFKGHTLEELETETHSTLRTAQDWTGFGPVQRLPR